MTARRKSLVLLLALGAIALVADRFIPRSENTALADEPDTAVAATAAALPVASPSPAAPAGPSLSERIRKAREQNPHLSSRDMFQVPLSWAGPPKSAQQTAAPTPPRFDETHRLTGLILAGERTGALIDGMLIKVGQSIDGYRLVSVANNTAVFESAGERAVLRVEKNTFASGN